MFYAQSTSMVISGRQLKRNQKNVAWHGTPPPDGMQADSTAALAHHPRHAENSVSATGGQLAIAATGSCSPTILYQSTQACAWTCCCTDPPHFSQSLDVSDAFFGCVVNLLLCGEPTNAKPDGTKTNLSDASFMGNNSFYSFSNGVWA